MVAPKVHNLSLLMRNIRQTQTEEHSATHHVNMFHRVKVTKNKKSLTHCHRMHEAKVTWNLNVTWDPGTLAKNYRGQNRVCSITHCARFGFSVLTNILQWLCKRLTLAEARSKAYGTLNKSELVPKGQNFTSG